MDVDDERLEIDRTFEQLSQSQSSASQKPRTQAAPIINQGKVGQRRNRRDEAKKNGKQLEMEPGFGNMPVNIQKNKRVLLEGLRNILCSKKMPAKKDAFNVTPLDKIDEVTDYLELSETGELLKFSSMVYGLRVDTTYNDAMATNCQLQPNRMKSQELGGKKTKAEQKLQQSTATQSLNLQKLQCEMEQDQPDDAATESGGTPDKELGLPELEPEEGAAGEEGAEGSEGEEGEGGTKKVVELTEEQKQKAKDAKPIDTSKVNYTTTVITDLLKEEFDRRTRKLARRFSTNPMLMDDERKFRMAPSALLTNEYYQIATARYKDLNAAGMLTYNAKVTHNGRMTLMHKRMDMWKDPDVHDYSPPTGEFRKALSGLVDNAMRETPMRLPHFLFDPADIPAEKKLLTTGSELADIEKKTRDKILQRDEDYDFLDDDEHVEDEEDEMVPPPIRKSVERKDDAGEGHSQTGPSSVGSSSLNPSTPAAETENSDTAAEQTPPKKKGGVNGGASQGEKEEDFMSVLSSKPAANNKKKLRKAGALNSVMCEDEIKMGPVLSTDELAAKFQQILFDKVSMGSAVEWRHGANSEELQTDTRTVNEESVFVEKCSIDMDLMHLDKLWSAKYYTKVVTPEEVKAIKTNMKRVLDNATYEKRVLYFKPGEYEFMGQDDKWHHPGIMPDEEAHLAEDDQPLVRPLEDAAELERFKRALAAAEEDSEADHGSYDVDMDDDRIAVVPEETDGDMGMEPINDDGGDMMSNGFMSDPDLDASSTRGAQSTTDFTAGDDQRPGERIPGDVHGMADPMYGNGMHPSATVRGTGKADDSHWKGGDPGNAEVKKKERKKKPKEEEELRTRGYFDCTEDMLDKVKTRNRFKQAQKNVELMKETDELLMPQAVHVVPQEDYNTSLYYHSFFLPQELHSKYVYRDRNNIVDPTDKEGEDVIQLDTHGRLGHYSHMLDSSMRVHDDEGGDVYFGFLRMFKNYPEVLTQREAEMEERVRTGQMRADDAAAELSNQEDEGGMENVGMDFGDDDFGGMGSGGDDYGGDDDGRPMPPLGPDSATFNKGERRETSQARSLALVSTVGFGMRVDPSVDGEEGDAVATVGDREYHLRLIKLDTVAMKTALSDVLTNPLMEADKLDETLGHFYRNIPTQRVEGERRRKERGPMQTINEDEEMEMEDRPPLDDSLEEEDEYSREVDYEATMMEVPDAMNVTRALFAPPKEKAKPNKTIMFGQGASTSQSHSTSADHIEIKGHHTLKSTFTCLPARMPLKATSDVTVASTIAMILHLANENNLILEQEGQNDGMDEDGNTTTTMGNWMNDFEVHCLDDDAEGTHMANVSQRISNAAELLQQLSADEDPMDAEKRQKETEKMLAELAARQRAEADEEKKSNGTAAATTRDQTGSSKAPAFRLDSSDDDDIVDVTTVEETHTAFKKPTTPHTVDPAVRRGPRKSDDYEPEDAPSSKRARTRISNGGNTTVNLEDTILID